MTQINAKIVADSISPLRCGMEDRDLYGYEWD